MMRDRERNESENFPRGLSRNQICIGVATDKKHTVCIMEGYGKPSLKRSYEAFKDHIKPGSILIRDKEKNSQKACEKIESPKQELLFIRPERTCRSTL